jgi:hypothetical protein
VTPNREPPRTRASPQFKSVLAIHVPCSKIPWVNYQGNFSEDQRISNG